MKLFTKILTILFAFLALFIGTEAFAATPSLMDGAGLLQKAEQQAVSDALREVEKKHNVRIGVVTVKGVNGDVGQFANQVLDRAYTDGQNGNLVLVLSMAERDWYISTDNTMRQKITDDEGINYLSESFLPSFGADKYAEGFKNFALRADEMLTYYETEGEAYDPSAEFSPFSLVVALILAALAGMGVRAGLIKSMSNVYPEPAASAYLDRDSFKLTESDDTYLYTTVSRRRKPKNNNNGHSSSNGSHGGGGGKF